jgi:hypothetical protein
MGLYGIPLVPERVDSWVAFAAMEINPLIVKLRP